MAAQQQKVVADGRHIDSAPKISSLLCKNCDMLEQVATVIVFYIV
mgnify:CR=1 FL=1